MRDLVYRTSPWTRHLYETRADARREGEWSSIEREIFGRIYGIGTERMDAPALGAEWAAKAHEQAEQLREWNEIVAAADGDPDFSLLGAKRITDTLAEIIETPEDPTEHEVLEDEGMAHPDGRALADVLGGLSRVSSSLDDDAKRRELRAKMRVAMGDAVKEIEELRAACRALGMPGATAEERRAIKELVLDERQGKQLREIALLAGRFSSSPLAVKAKTEADGFEDVRGVKYGQDIARALPIEKAMLRRPETKRLVQSRFIESRLLMNHQVGLVKEDKLGEGPLIFVVDESGSMCAGSSVASSRDVHAKALLLAAMKLALAARRPFAVVHFGGAVGRVAGYAKGATPSELVEELTYFTGGGTAIDEALCAAADVVTGARVVGFSAKDRKAADVILLTDAESGESCEGGLDALRRSGARLWTICLSPYTHHNLANASERYAMASEADQLVAEAAARELRGA